MLCRLLDEANICNRSLKYYGSLCKLIRGPALTADFTYEHFFQEAAEELLRVKDLEKSQEHYNLMAE